MMVARWRVTHNVWLQVAAELGIFGLCTFAFLVWRAYHSLLRGPAGHPRPDEEGSRRHDDVDASGTEDHRQERQRHAGRPGGLDGLCVLRVGRFQLDVLLRVRPGRRRPRDRPRPARDARTSRGARCCDGSIGRMAAAGVFNVILELGIRN